MPAGQRPNETVDGELPTWEGSPLDADNRGAFLESGTKFCVIGSPTKWKILVVLQQSDMNRVRIGDEARVRLDQFPNSLRCEQTFSDVDWGAFAFWLYAQTGQHGRAIETLEDLYVRPGAYGSVAMVHVLFGFALLGDDPRYQALLEEAGITW